MPDRKRIAWAAQGRYRILRIQRAPAAWTDPLASKVSPVIPARTGMGRIHGMGTGKAEKRLGRLYLPYRLIARHRTALLVFNAREWFGVP
jgi:hypothetical protein